MIELVFFFLFVESVVYFRRIVRRLPTTDSRWIRAKEEMRLLGRKIVHSTVDTKDSIDISELPESSCYLYTTWQVSMICWRLNVWFKKVSVDLFTRLIVGLYFCFTQTMCINNEWKCNFWNARCLFHQVDSISIHFQILQMFLPQKSTWNTTKIGQLLQRLKTPQKWYLRHAEHKAKNRTSLCGLDQNTRFYEWPFTQVHEQDNHQDVSFLCPSNMGGEVKGRNWGQTYPGWSREWTSDVPKWVKMNYMVREVFRRKDFRQPYVQVNRTPRPGWERRGQLWLAHHRSMNYSPLLSLRHAQNACK